MSQNPERPLSPSEDNAELVRRIGNLEKRALTNVYEESVDCGGLLWTAANPNWVDPSSVPEWSEIRLRNTPAGSQVYRAVKDAVGSLEWRQVV